MKIEFYNTQKELPTVLAVRADDETTVYYEPIGNGMFSFEMWNDVPEDKAKEIVEAICEIFVRQSYNHGDGLRLDKIEKVSDGERYGRQVWEASFHWHDAY